MFEYSIIPNQINSLYISESKQILCWTVSCGFSKFPVSQHSKHKILLKYKITSKNFPSSKTISTKTTVHKGLIIGS